MAVLDWDEPITNGSPVTGYKVYVLESDGLTYTQESVACGSLGTSRQCTVPLTTLTSAPYSLAQGDSI